MASLIIFLISTVMVVCSLFFGAKNYAWVSEAKSAPGEVIELIAQKGSKGGVSYAPKVRYQWGGTSKEFVSSLSSASARFSVGDVVKVAVHERAGKATIATFGEIYGLPFLGFLIGFTALVGLLVTKMGPSIMMALHPHLFER